MKYIFLAVFGLILNYQSFTQKIIKYDFDTKTFTNKPSDLEFGKYYCVQIENINLAHYDIKDSNTSIAFNIEVPSAFSGLSISPIIFLANNEATDNQSPGNQDRLGADEKNQVISKNNESNYNQEINKLRELDNDLQNLLNSCDLKTTEIISMADKLVRLYLYPVDPLLKKDDLWKLLGAKVTSLMTQISTDSKLPSTSAVKKFAIEFIGKNKVKTLIDNYLSCNESNFTYTSKPFKVKADLVKIEINLSKKKQLPCEGLTNTLIYAEIYAKGKTKVDFSTGLFLNYGGSTFHGPELLFEKSATYPDSSIVTSIESLPKLLLSIGGFVHIYKRNTSETYHMYTFGISTTSGFDNINLHGGISLAFGKQSRFIVTAGLTARESFKASDKYSIGSNHLTEGLPETPPTIKRFPALGCFIGFSYNWTDPSKR